MRVLVLISLLSVPFIAAAQQSSAAMAKELRAHVEYLASDKLKGRLAGSKSEKKASKYILKQFKSVGLMPLPALDGYLQPFSFYTPLKEAKGNYLRLAGEELNTGQYLPMPYTANAKVESNTVDVGFGIKAEELKHDDYQHKKLAGKVFVINLGSPDGIHPHSAFLKYHGARERVKMAMDYNPAAIIFHSSEKDLSRRMLKAFNNLSREQVPIVYVMDSAFTAKLKGSSLKAEMDIDLFQEERTGHNVVAYQDNGADKLIVIGAHYDHLGYNEYGNSLYRGEPDIHNGADDNASGTAMLIELAQRVSSKPSLKGSNYLFVAFSAEELGLLGSNFLSKSEQFADLPVSFMLNYDMVGRLDPKERDLGLHGTGTSPNWDKLIEEIITPEFEISKEQSGMGSSDHTSFYLRDLPVLSFFTGSHEDYHKPSDDADKINYDGMADILAYSMNLLEVVDDMPPFEFTKTSNAEGRKAPRFSVTLGIVPDYFGKVEGLRIDGVSEGKPAAKAGLKAGDVIIRMGDIDIKDMMSYMEALSAFKKGDKTEVEVIRDSKPQTFKVSF